MWRIGIDSNCSDRKSRGVQLLFPDEGAVTAAGGGIPDVRVESEVDGATTTRAGTSANVGISLAVTAHFSAALTERFAIGPRHLLGDTAQTPNRIARKQSLIRGYQRQVINVGCCRNESVSRVRVRHPNASAFNRYVHG
jgi:hypothetical protein